MGEGVSLGRSVLAGWLLVSLILCLANASGIAALRFPDPDDAMRLLQVRDWLAGQSFWDVSQHRLNGGTFAMHWSRLVDLPLALGFVTIDPLVSEGIADRVVMTLVPLLTLLAAMALAARLALRVGGPEVARLAILVLPLSPPILYQLRPMRIDHHGWQVVLALAATLALVGRPNWRTGAAVGGSLALLLNISLEGLPFAAATGMILALAWSIQPERREQLTGFATTLAAGAFLLHLATRGPAMWQPACDAMSAGWLAAIGAGAAGLVAALAVAPRRWWSRLLALCVAGAVTLAVLAWAAPTCLRGPFATLDPLVRSVWYGQITEGLPLWRQTGDQAVLTIALPVVGLIGSLLRYRRSSGDARDRWLLLFCSLAAATFVACLVNRAGATANALAVPGSAALLSVSLQRARAVSHALPRTGATAGALMLASPGIVASPLVAAIGVAGPPAFPRPTQPICTSFADLRVVGQLAPATIFLPIDPTPDVIATTRVHAVAGGYHRNAGALHRVIEGFASSPEAARHAIVASGADYLASCPGLNEAQIYSSRFPAGLWARLMRGERFAWLEPVSLRHTPVRVWRIVRYPEVAQPMPRR